MNYPKVADVLFIQDPEKALRLPYFDILSKTVKIWNWLDMAARLELEFWNFVKRSGIDYYEVVDAWVSFKDDGHLQHWQRQGSGIASHTNWTCVEYTDDSEHEIEAKEAIDESH